MKAIDDRLDLIEHCVGDIRRHGLNNDLIQWALDSVAELRAISQTLPNLVDGSITAVHLQDGDRLVLKTRVHLNTDEVELIKQRLAGQFGSVPVTVLSGDLSLTLVRDARTADRLPPRRIMELP